MFFLINQKKIIVHQILSVCVVLKAIHAMSREEKSCQIWMRMVRYNDLMQTNLLKVAENNESSLVMINNGELLNAVIYLNKVKQSKLKRER